MIIILQTAATGAFDQPNRSRGSHDLADVINVTAFHSPNALGHLTDGKSRRVKKVAHSLIKYVNTTRLIIKKNRDKQVAFVICDENETLILLDLSQGSLITAANLYY